jgi:hypothetical protein
MVAAFTIAAASTGSIQRSSGAPSAERAAAAVSRAGTAAETLPNTGTVQSRRGIAIALVRGSGRPEGPLVSNVPLIPTQTVSGVLPNAGASGAGGEQAVTITGTGFTGATDVFFGSTDVSSTAYPCLPSPAGCFDQVSDTEIDADTPLGSAGTFDVVVNGSPTGPPDQYSYFDPPTVASVPGPQQQGATGIPVTGTNFSYPSVTPFVSGVSEVDLVPTGVGSTVSIATVCSGGGQPNCFLATDDKDLTVNLPNSMTAGQYDTKVITPGGTSATSLNDKLVVLPPTPTLTNLNPSSGSTAGGNNVTLTGTFFTGATDVNWGALDISTVCGSGTCFTVDSDTQIIVDSIPNHGAGGVSVTVTTPGGTTSSKTYTYVTPPPTLTNLNLPSGSTAGGNDVVLTGTFFTGATDVHVGSHDLTTCPGAPCFTFNGDTQITATMPPNAAGGVNVHVVTPGGTTNDLTYTYVTPPPTLTNLDQSSGSTAGGNGVALTGTNFTGATDVHVGVSDLAPCGSGSCFTINSDTQITVTMPANTPGIVNVNVTTPGGTTASLQYTYVAPAPTVTGVSPKEGAPAGGNLVTLTGTGFEAAGAPIVSQVTLIQASGVATTITATPCGVSPTAPCFTVTNAITITIGFQPSGTGQVNITVTTPGGTSPATSQNAYTYSSSFPTVTELLPKDGTTGGGEAVSLFGSGFGQAGQDFVTDVFFGTTDVPSSNTYPCPSTTTGCFIVVGPTQLAIYTPANAAGTSDVTVATPIPPGRSNPGPADKYTFVAPGAYSAVSPYRVCDTRPPVGGISHNECNTGVGSNKTLGTNGAVTAQITTTVSGQVPLGAQAVVVNVTAIDHGSGPTFVTAYPAGESRPVASNINLAGRTVEANLVIVQLSSTGGITLFNAIGSTDVIVDVEGYFAATSGSAGEFHSIPPLRICDSRAGAGTICAGASSTPLQALKWRDVVLSGLPPGAPTGTPSIPATPGTAAAAVFNLTAVVGTQATYLTVAPALAGHTCPTGAPSFSNVNPSAGIALPNRVISSLGPNQDVCVFSAAGSINFVIDVNGWFGSAGVSGGVLFYSVPPTRVCDTRPTSGTECATSPPTPGLGPGQIRAVAIAGVLVVPADNAHSTAPVAVVANLTGVVGTAATVFTLFPSDAARPRASDLNPSAGEVIANLAIVGLSTTVSDLDGDVSLYNNLGDINAILDVAGWFQ